MPEICRFFGIIVRMFAEPTAQHQRPHFHAYYQDSAAVFAIDSTELLCGGLPQRHRRLVEAWIEIIVTSSWTIGGGSRRDSRRSGSSRFGSGVA